MDFHSLTTHQQKIIAHFAWTFMQFGTTDLKVWVMSDGEYIDSAELDKLVEQGLFVRFPGTSANYGHDTYSAKVTALEMGLEMLAFVLKEPGEVIITVSVEPEQPTTPKKGRIAYPPKQKIKLALQPDSTISPEIEADIVGRFAVHIDQHVSKREYTITHTESGYEVIPLTRYNFRGRHARRIAIECARELDATLSKDCFYKEDSVWKVLEGARATTLWIIGRHSARKE